MREHGLTSIGDSIRKKNKDTISAEELNNFDKKEEHWQESNIRSVIKGISWRIVGTFDTIIIATLWTGDYSKALKIGFTEVITKIILFYFHERIWMRYTQKKETAATV